MKLFQSLESPSSDVPSVTAGEILVCRNMVCRKRRNFGQYFSSGGLIALDSHKNLVSEICQSPSIMPRVSSCALRFRLLLCALFCRFGNCLPHSCRGSLSSSSIVSFSSEHTQLLEAALLSATSLFLSLFSYLSINHVRNQAIHSGRNRQTQHGRRLLVDYRQRQQR